MRKLSWKVRFCPSDGRKMKADLGNSVISREIYRSGIRSFVSRQSRIGRTPFFMPFTCPGKMIGYRDRRQRQRLGEFSRKRAWSPWQSTPLPAIAATGRSSLPSRNVPGEGKNALLALLSLAEVKMVIVTDDNINIYDPVELDWALTFRVQADRDVIIVSGAPGKTY